MERMRCILDVEDQGSLRDVVVSELKELGIKLPKPKKNKGKDLGDSLSVECNNHVFGNHLGMVPAVDLEEYGQVPKFLVDAMLLLQKHSEVEGLFRKSGSVARQKELKQRMEIGADLNDANPLDVSSLVKQFFRELPDPLFTTYLHDTFLRTRCLDCESDRLPALLLLCLLLPSSHLATLRFTMAFLNSVAQQAEQNKMDAANLAVCLAPNLLHSNHRGDKAMNATESKMLQSQTSIVQLLIEYAGSVGLVSDLLYEQVQMMGCLRSDEELEATENTADDSKVKKKKKRSGSLQGLVSNLSSSFSRWRKDGRHNTSSLSDRSALSYASIDRSSILAAAGENAEGLVGTLVPIDYADMACEATPKLIRKRKAEDDAVPFSASKKKAILKNMPQMATLGGTPFTPMTKRAGRPTEYFDTPSIKFANNADAVFNATTPRLATPKKNKLFSPVSSSKVKRSATIHGNSKSGCFSPKTPKSNMRKSVRGFFRRLSGGKDQQLQSPSKRLLNTSDVGSRMAYTGGVPDQLVILPPNGQKKKGLFRRHKKTPSSPARLMTPVTSVTSNMSHYMNAPGEPIDSSSIKSPCPSREVSVSSLELANRLRSDLESASPQFLGDADQVTPRMHKRGFSEENTPSGSTCLRRGKPNTMKSGLPSPYHRRSIDNSIDPSSMEREDLMECVPGAFDTSPIPKAPDSMEDMCEGAIATPEVLPANGNGIDRQTSVVSITSNMEVCDNLISEHDQAFLNESYICPDTTNYEPDESPGSTTNTECSPHCADGSLSNTSVLSRTVSASSSHSAVAESAAPRGSATYTAKASLRFSHQRSVDSVDSAVDVSPTECLDTPPDVTGRLQKAGSTHSVRSCDSGVSLDDASHQAKGKLQAHRYNVTSSAQSYDVTGSSQSYDVTGSSQSTPTENDTPDQDLRQSIADLHNAAKVKNGVDKLETDPDRYQSPLRFPNATSRKRGNASPVRIPTIFARADREAEHFRDLARSVVRTPLRSSIRRPNLPISTALVRSSEVESACNRLGCTSASEALAKKSVEENNHTPEGEMGRDDTIGHTPFRVLEDNSLHTRSVHRDRNNGQESVLSTPRIKPALLARDVTKQVLSKNFAVAAPGDTPARCRSPVKPVKRLQGSPRSPAKSPRSPRAYSRSPRRTGANSGANRPASPIPVHVKDWEI